MKNKDLKLSLMFAIIGLIAGIFLGLYQISTLSDLMREKIVSQLGSVKLLIPISAVQVALYSFISSFAGIKIARKCNLNFNYKHSYESIVKAIVFGFITALIISASDKFIFAQYLNGSSANYNFSTMYFILSILYGGIVEELMMRLLVMSLPVFMLKKLFCRNTDNLNIPS